MSAPNAEEVFEKWWELRGLEYARAEGKNEPVQVAAVNRSQALALFRLGQQNPKWKGGEWRRFEGMGGEEAWEFWVGGKKVAIVKKTVTGRYLWYGLMGYPTVEGLCDDLASAQAAAESALRELLGQMIEKGEWV